MSEKADQYRQERLAARSGKYKANVANLKLAVDNTRRNLCSHGVAPNLCVDHRKTTETEPEESA